jgi:hypothetical protein
MKTGQQDINTYNSLLWNMLAAYALPSFHKLAPDANKPALKKYGDVLPLFRTNEPNFRTPCCKLNSRNSFWYSAISVASAHA